MKSLYILTLLFVWANALVAKTTVDGTPTNNDYQWGEKQEEAKGNWMYLNNAVDQKDYQAALTPLHWLLTNSHDLNVALYIQGSKILEENEKLATDPIHKKQLQDSALWLYDERVKLYGDEANVINRKGRVAWKYLHKRPNSEDDLYALYQNIYSKNENNMLILNSTYYFRTAITVFRQNKIDKPEILALYSSMISFLDNQVIEQPQKTTLIEKNRTRINKEFDKYVSLNCEEIQTFYQANYTENPTIEEAKKINSLLVKKSCVSNDFFMTTNEFILLNEPTANRYKVTAKLYLKQGDHVKSYTYFTKAIALENDTKTKAALYMELAKIDKKNNAFTTARTNARQAIQLEPNNTLAYEFIGDLYFLSANQCTSEDILKNKSIYIAAYNMYQKAGNTAKMNTAQQQFPSIEEIFVRNKKEGDTINTGCWINETVQLKKR